MYEDSAVELEAFEPGGRIFCIASAGCTSFDLAARGDDVTAVDINPAQVAYVRRRLAGEAIERGRIDRRFDQMRQIAPALGWTRATLERFCDLDETDEQLEFWRGRLDTRRLRLALAAAFSPRLLRRIYDLPFVDVLPARFDRILLRRLERGFGRHPNAGNPYASALLLGRTRHHACSACRGIGRRDRLPRSLRAGELRRDHAVEHPGRRGQGLQRSPLRRRSPSCGAGSRHDLAQLPRAHRRRRLRWAARDQALFWGSIRVERL